MIIYVAGPYTQGDVAQNVRRAIEAGNRLLDAGHAPYIPHLTHFWHLLFPHSYRTWLDLDREFLKCCHALVRLPGKSAGADTEVHLARKWQLPVFDGIQELARYYDWVKYNKVESPGSTSVDGTGSPASEPSEPTTPYPHP